MWLTYLLFVLVLTVEGVEGGRYFFSTVREGDQIMFATDDESERTLWVQAVYRATGQSHKPVPPTNQPQRTTNTQLSKVQGGRHCSNLLLTLIIIACAMKCCDPACLLVRVFVTSVVIFLEV